MPDVVNFVNTGGKIAIGLSSESSNSNDRMLGGRDSSLPLSALSHPRVSRNQMREGSPGPEQQQTSLLRLACSGLCPTQPDSPSPSSTNFSSVATELEVRDALYYMRKFLQDEEQDASDNLRFMYCIDMISATIYERGEKFMSDVYNASLIRDALRFLFPAASSPNGHEREATLARITKLIGWIPSHAIGKGIKDLKPGRLAGCFALCSCDPCEAVCLWAADGLHHLYTLIMRLKCNVKTADNQNYEELLKEWEEEKIFWLAWFSDAMEATTIFKRHLRAGQQTDFILMTIKGMKNDNILNTKCAARMLKTMLKDPVPDLVRASKAIQFTYNYLEHITDIQARHEVFQYLCLLGSANPEEVVNALLGCSLQCDSISAAMWRTLTRSSDPAMKILTTLQTVLLEQPLISGSPGTKASLNPLAAVSALYEILRCPTQACEEVLREIYPTLSIAVLCQISYAMHFMPKELELYWSTCIQQKTPTPQVPFRSALRTFNALLKCASNNTEVVAMSKRRGSEMLLNPLTHQKGLYVFARAIIKNESCASILPYLLKILDNPEDFRHITVMTFLVELLRYQSFDNITEYQVIRQLWKQLNATKVELRSLALDGMLQLAAHSEKMAKLEPALPDLLARLKESNRTVNVKALKVLRYLLKSLETEEMSPITVEVASRVIPLFDDASHRVRLAAICTFNCLFEIIKKEEKGNMKTLAIQSLVPLMVHLYDDSPPVVEASWDGLKKVDLFLKSFFQIAITEKDAWNYCISILKRYRKQGESIFVEQAFSYLENPRHTVRDAALKLLEIIAMGSKSKETLSAIATVLNLLQRDSEPSSTDLIPHIMGSVAQESSSENVRGNCCTRFWKI